MRNDFVGTVFMRMYFFLLFPLLSCYIHICIYILFVSLLSVSWCGGRRGETGLSGTGLPSSPALLREERFSLVWPREREEAVYYENDDGIKRVQTQSNSR